jgi:hypothetical protein
MNTCRLFAQFAASPFICARLRKSAAKRLAAPCSHPALLAVHNYVAARRGHAAEIVVTIFPMPRMVKCVKLGRELPGLNEPPFDTELGQKIYENVSAEAW